jgi:hypothetical protein
MLEQEERAKLWFWLEFMDWKLEPDYVEQLVQIAVQARQINDMVG